MKKEDKKLFQLKNELLQDKKLSIKEISDLLKINRSRVYDYLHILEEEGITLDTIKEGRNVFYYLPSPIPIESNYIPLSSKDIQKQIILLCISQKPQSRDEIYESINAYSAMPQSSFYLLIDEMIDEGIIATRKQEVFNPSSKKKVTKILLYQSGLYNSIFLNVDFESWNLILTDVASGQAQSQALNSLKRKISILTGDNETYDFSNSFILYGRHYHMDAKMQEYYQLLVKNNFQKNVLSFKYRCKDIKFAVGLVVYSQDKDMLYLIGRKIGTHNITILKLSDVTDLTYTKQNNTEYNHPKYNECLTNMFSISSDPPEEVRVQFKKDAKIYSKLSNLCNLRTKARLEIKKDKLIYTDLISGINDFANFLRGFGYKNFQVEYPESLKNTINSSIKRLKIRYGED